MSNMWVQIIIAFLAFLGTLIGSIAGILTANKLTNYRVEQLEKKVAVHNNLVDRMYGAEGRIDVIEEKVKVANHRLDDLEKESIGK